MNDVIATTKKAFDDAQKAAVNSSNQMIQKIGQLMNQLASNTGSIGIAKSAKVQRRPKYSAW